MLVVLFFWDKQSPIILFKALSILFLILLALRYCEDRLTRYSKNILAGLIFGVCGDVFLVNGSEESFFISGLSCFLIGHIFYIIAFIKIPKKHNIPVLITLIVFVTVLLYFLITSLMDQERYFLIYPVIIYGLVITTMAYFGIITGYKTIIIGVICFVLSDTALSIRKFVQGADFLRQWEDIVPAGLFVWTLYCLAQSFMVLSIREIRRSAKT